MADHPHQEPGHRPTTGHDLTRLSSDEFAESRNRCSRWPTPGPSPLETQADHELRSAVGTAVAELPQAQQQAIELAYYEGLSHAEIAQRLNQPLGTVKTRIKLGMSKLRDSLQQWGSHGELQ